MTQRYYSFAGLRFCVDLPEDTELADSRRLGVFSCEPGPWDHRFRVSLADVLDPPEGERIHGDNILLLYGTTETPVRYLSSLDGTWQTAHTRIRSREKDHWVQIKRGVFANRISEQAFLNSLGLEHLIARAGGFILHCSYIIRHGKAVLFTAPSGTGKSTQADLWHELRGSEIVNGDRAAVSIRGGVPVAQGIPFAGSSSYCENRTAPIAAVVYLGQAPETTIRRLKGYEAFSRIWEGVSVNTWDKTDMEHVSAAVSAVASQVPVFHLPCTPDESAVCVLEDALRKLESL